MFQNMLFLKHNILSPLNKKISGKSETVSALIKLLKVFTKAMDVHLSGLPVFCYFNVLLLKHNSSVAVKLKKSGRSETVSALIKLLKVFTKAMDIHLSGLPVLFFISIPLHFRDPSFLPRKRLRSRE